MDRFACCLYFLESSICLLHCLHLFCCISCKPFVVARQTGFEQLLTTMNDISLSDASGRSTEGAMSPLSSFSSLTPMAGLAAALQSTSPPVASTTTTWWVNFYSLWTTAVSWLSLLLSSFDWQWLYILDYFGLSSSCFLPLSTNFMRVSFDLPFVDCWFSGEVCFYVVVNPSPWIVFHDKRTLPYKELFVGTILSVLRNLCVWWVCWLSWMLIVLWLTTVVFLSCCS